MVMGSFVHFVACNPHGLAIDYPGQGNYRHHRGLAQDNAFSLRINQGVGSPKVDG
jgi:hypothetical protein